MSVLVILEKLNFSQILKIHGISQKHPVSRLPVEVGAKSSFTFTYNEVDFDFDYF